MRRLGGMVSRSRKGVTSAISTVLRLTIGRINRLCALYVECMNKHWSPLSFDSPYLEKFGSSVFSNKPPIA